MFTGGASRGALRPSRHVDRRGAALLADAKASSPSPVEVDLRPSRPANSRHASMGGQLRSSVRFHLRFPGGIRVDAVHLIRPLRPPPQDLANLDLPDPHRRPVHPSSSPVL